MKKAMVYVSTAILLGFAIMMLPKALETYAPQSGFASPPKTRGFELAGQDSSNALWYAQVRQPLDLLPSSLIIFSGLIVALSVYAILRRRII